MIAVAVIWDLEHNEKKKRIEFLIERQNQKQNRLEKNDFGVVFDECMEALGDDTTIFSSEKSNELYTLFQDQVPFTPYARIDWSKVVNHHLISDLYEVFDLLNKEYVEVYWSYGNFPVIKTKFQNVINAFDDLTAVSSDTYLYIKNKCVIEIYHEGGIIIGYL